MKAQWDAKNQRLLSYANLKEKLDRLKTEEAQAERDGNLERAATIRYGEIVEVQNNMKEAERKLEQVQQEQQNGS